MKDLAQALYQFHQFSFDQDISMPAFERKRFLIQRTVDWELILMAWGPGATTSIHSHLGSQCWSRILRGGLEERVLASASLQELEIRRLLVTDESYIDDDLGAHFVSNPHSSVCLSVHLYAAPIESCLLYDPGTQAWKEQKVVTQKFNEVEYEFTTSL